MSEVLWLNKETLEERWLQPYFCFINPSLWVEVPEGATFATGDKDNFVFRKDGWYYEDGEWVETNVLLKHFPDYKYIKLFWIESEYLWDVSDNKFTLERLLGCEVKLFGERFYLSEESLRNMTIICKKLDKDVEVGLGCLTFFTEDGDELTFDGYVTMYYGDNCVQS